MRLLDIGPVWPPRTGLLGNLGDLDGLDSVRMPQLPGEDGTIRDHTGPAAGSDVFLGLGEIDRMVNICIYIYMNIPVIFFETKPSRISIEIIEMLPNSDPYPASCWVSNLWTNWQETPWDEDRKESLKARKFITGLLPGETAGIWVGGDNCGWLFP